MYAYGYMPQEQHPLGETTNEGAVEGGHEDRHGEHGENASAPHPGQPETGLDYPPLDSAKATGVPPHENGKGDKTASPEDTIISRKEAKDHSS